MFQSEGFPTVSYAFCVGQITTTTKLGPFLSNAYGCTAIGTSTIFLLYYEIVKKRDIGRGVVKI